MTRMLADLDAWIDAHWDPALSVGAWWELLADAGWAAPALPKGRYGRAASPDEVVSIAVRFRDRGILTGPTGAALSVVAPTLCAHLPDDRVEALLRPVVTGRHGWCLLFSEPAAGTDLANLSTVATRDGDGWRLDGRKTWATGAHLADMALVLARSDPASSRHQGLTCFALDMARGDTVEVRPMRDMTGRTLSNDVELRGAWAVDVVGDVGDGWRVVQTALTSERTSVGADRSTPVRPGTRGGELDCLVGDVVGRSRSRGRRRGSPAPDAVAREAARRAGPVLHDELARLQADVDVARWVAARAADVPGSANIAKLHAGIIARRSAAVAGAARGAAAMVHEYGGEDPVTSLVLAAPAVSLVAGVDLVQRDLLGERALGLPKAP